jgi:hypothetical protein
MWRCGLQSPLSTSQRGQSSTAGAGSVIGAIMLLAPRIMRGELDKLPKRHLPDGFDARPLVNDLSSGGFP